MLKPLFLLLAAAPVPAMADTTAVYSAQGGEMTMTVEVASNGDVHVQMGGAMVDEMRKRVPGAEAPAMIMRDGEGYMIQQMPGKTTVARVSDITAVMADYMASHPPASVDPAAAAPDSHLIEHGAITINGRTGAAFYTEDDKQWTAPVVVISRDADLAELGAAIRRNFEMTMTMSVSMFHGAGGGLLAALATGAPLDLGAMQLDRVTHDPIPAAHFVLPVAPQTREALRAWMTPRAQPTHAAPSVLPAH